MLPVFSASHRLHHGIELKDGRIAPSFEAPSRADTVLERVRVMQLGDVEGGCLVDEIGVNAVNVLLGYEGRG
ncbi:hypothetical protein [Trinickia mobilis]|uniref:hypothetical protein n=1 Tax=Trinickia mobilis TaxID=2816356 RepID=UPI001A8F80D3|nr:hypothetical protein [Trinickia mobilis]